MEDLRHCVHDNRLKREVQWCGEKSCGKEMEIGQRVNFLKGREQLKREKEFERQEL